MILAVILTLIFLFFLFFILGNSSPNLKNSLFSKGKYGESYVSSILNHSLPKEQYFVLDDVTLPTADGRTTQIDHIVISLFGVFVIETKNMSGWIFGDKYQKKWTQVLFEVKNTFMNPLHQNYKHTQTLIPLLRVNKNYVFSIITFVGDSLFKTPMPENVVYREQVIDYIFSKNKIVFSLNEIKKFEDIISSTRLTRGWSTDKIHIKNMKKKPLSLNGS